MKLPENWIPIAGASNYALSPDDYVYNVKTFKKVKRYWENLKNYSFVYDDNGDYRKVCHSNPTTERYGLPDDDMKVIPDYPDYKVTYYGAIWKYRKTGSRHRGNPFIVSSKYIGDTEYARLKTEDGRAHWVRVDKVMEELYPDD